MILLSDSFDPDEFEAALVDQEAREGYQILLNS
jgi:hypothetical protein